MPLNLAAYYFGAALAVGHAWYQLIVPAIIYVAIYRALLRTANYLRTTLTITDRQIIKETGVFEIESQALPLESLTDSTIRRSVLGRILGYGQHPRRHRRHRRGVLQPPLCGRAAGVLGHRPADDQGSREHDRPRALPEQ